MSADKELKGKDMSEEYDLLTTLGFIISVSGSPHPGDTPRRKIKLMVGHAKTAIKQVNQLQDEVDRLKPYETAIKKRHNGYDPENELCPVPESPEKALQDLQDGWDATEDDYAGEIVRLKEALETLRWIPVEEGPPDEVLRNKYNNISILDNGLPHIGAYRDGKFVYWHGTFCNLDCIFSQDKITHYRLVILPKGG